MFATRGLALIGLLGLFLSWIVIRPLVSYESETPVEATVCSRPPVSANFIRSSALIPVTLDKPGSAIQVPLGLSFSSLGRNYAGKHLTYAIGLRPVQVEHLDPIVVATGSVPSTKEAFKETIKVENVTIGSSFEISIEVAPQLDTNGTLSSRIDKDLLYLTVVPSGKEKVALKFSEPVEYWDTWLSNLYTSNKTIPVLPVPSSSCTSTCEEDIPSEPASPIFTPLLLPYPIGGPGDLPDRGKTTYKTTIRVRWQDPSNPSLTPPLAGATVWVYIQDMDDDTRTTYGFSSLILNSAGYATKKLTIPNRQYVSLVTVAFDSPKLRFVSAVPTQSHIGRSGGIEYPLPYSISQDEGTLAVNTVIPASFGPELVRLWYEFSGILATADALVGWSDIPKINIRYPADWSRYRRGTNTIDIWGSAGSLAADHFAHEIGHHFMQSVAGGIPGQGGPHTICGGDPVERGLAFSEGYATAFAANLLGRQRIANVEFGDYECPTDREMETAEGRVAAGLIDLIDGGAAECNNNNEDFGRDGVCDGTTAGELFTPRILFRDSVRGVVDAGVTAWWGRMVRLYGSRAGFRAARAAMEYNYYPQECLIRWQGVCVRILPWDRWRFVPPLL
ncbi:hypothetical protein QBC35DRAFT_134892 [Podospora australis]|uniref:Uncharacterized protein n=1 Tax=Podospora australis TaxID=1536484 RepID=A0AAN6WMF4_9PEZI|nr:hypothetical protein QBC35DRAFT_134892 [Podospora australis]